MDKLISIAQASDGRFVDFSGAFDFHIDFLEGDDVRIFTFDDVGDALQIKLAVRSFAVMDVV